MRRSLNINDFDTMLYISGTTFFRSTFFAFLIVPVAVEQVVLWKVQVVVDRCV